MFFTRSRRKPAAQPTQQVVYTRPAPKPDPRIKRVEQLEQRYFLASAIANHMMRTRTGDASYQIGTASRVSDAIAIVLGKDPIYVMCCLERGHSPLVRFDLPWVPKDYTNAYDHIEDYTERLTARYRDALRADGHPLYTILFHPERIR